MIARLESLARSAAQYEDSGLETSLAARRSERDGRSCAARGFDWIFTTFQCPRRILESHGKEDHFPTPPNSDLSTSLHFRIRLGGLVRRHQSRNLPTRCTSLNLESRTNAIHRSTVISVRRSIRSVPISRGSRAIGDPCSAKYGEGVRRLRSRRATRRPVEKRPTSPLPKAKDFVSPTQRETHPPFFARIVRSESSSRFRQRKLARILNIFSSSNVDLITLLDFPAETRCFRTRAE